MDLRQYVSVKIAGTKKNEIFSFLLFTGYSFCIHLYESAFISDNNDEDT